MIVNGFLVFQSLCGVALDAEACGKGRHAEDRKRGEPGGPVQGQNFGMLSQTSNWKALKV